MEGTLRFFLPGEFKPAVEYDCDNLIIPHKDDVVSVENEPYMVNLVVYDYDGPTVLIDIMLRALEPNKVEEDF